MVVLESRKKNNKEIVLAAVTQTSLALQYASTDLQKDPEVIAASKL